MIVLGFDTATPATAVALGPLRGEFLEERHDPGPGERPGHTTRLLDLCEQLLDRASLGWESLGRIAVGVGPGTFTGLRIGVATAQGLARSLSIELVGVSTLTALAHEALAHEALTHEALTHEALTHEALTHEALTHEALAHEALAHEALTHEALAHEALAHEALAHEALARGVIARAARARGEGVPGAGLLGVLDARRGEFFVAAYAARGGSAGMSMTADGAGSDSLEELVSARAIAPEKLGGVLAEAQAACEIQTDDWLAVGDGAVRYSESLVELGCAVPAARSPLHLVRGRAICALGALEPAAEARSVLPAYGRRADAEIALEEALQSEIVLEESLR